MYKNLSDDERNDQEHPDNFQYISEELKGGSRIGTSGSRQ